MAAAMLWAAAAQAQDTRTSALGALDLLLQSRACHSPGHTAAHHGVDCYHRAQQARFCAAQHAIRSDNIAQAELLLRSIMQAPEEEPQEGTVGDWHLNAKQYAAAQLAVLSMRQGEAKRAAAGFDTAAALGHFPVDSAYAAAYTAALCCARAYAYRDCGDTLRALHALLERAIIPTDEQDDEQTLFYCTLEYFLAERGGGHAILDTIHAALASVFFRLEDTYPHWHISSYITLFGADLRLPYSLVGHFPTDTQEIALRMRSTPLYKIARKLKYETK